jgi:hypothetical protein
MGKYEREWAEEAEKSVAAALNKITVDDEYINDIAFQIQNQINEPIDHAKWVGGNDYSNPGDVHVYLTSNKIVKIELKFSKEDGNGTLKNRGARFLKQDISNTIQTYPEFEQSYKKQRYDLVEAHIGRPLKNQSDYIRELRRLRSSPIIEDNQILDKVADITSPGQIAYASYAAGEMKKYLINVNQVVDKMLATNKVEVKQDILYCVIKKFSTKAQKVYFYDFQDMDRNVTDVISTGKSIQLVNTNEKKVITMSVTWKNICQGGATPCFNVFLGNEFYS